MTPSLTSSGGRTEEVSLTLPLTTTDTLNVVITSFVMVEGEPITTSSTYCNVIVRRQQSVSQSVSIDA